jgi:RNA polymerase II-associated factor 1
VPDPRLETAIIRPVVGEDGESYLSYYLTAEDAETEVYQSHREIAFERSAHERAKGKKGDEEPTTAPKVAFHFVRDYETVKIDMDVPNEFLLMLDSGEGVDTSTLGDDGMSEAPKGAFYKNIERKYVLRKKKRQMVSRAICAKCSMLTCSI